MDVLLSTLFPESPSQPAEERFIGLDGATSLKAEMVARMPVLNNAAHYREARKLLHSLGGMQALRGELVYSGFVDPYTRKLNTGKLPYNCFARLAAGVETQQDMEKEQAALGEYQKSYLICRNLADLDLHWDSTDTRWVKIASMSKRHRFLTTKSLDWQWFNPLLFGMLDEGQVDSDQVTVREALIEVERMKKAALSYTKTIGRGWSDKIGLFFNIFGHNRVNSLYLHIVDLSEVGPAFTFQQFKNLALDEVVTVLREETKVALRPSPVTVAGRSSNRNGTLVAAQLLSGADGATSVKDELVARLPVLRDAGGFRAARGIMRQEFGGVEALKEELLRANFIDATTNCLTTGMSPFNVFARIGAGVMTQPGMQEEQVYLGDYQDRFMVCRNRVENDENWESNEQQWLGKVSMSKLHRFLIIKDLNWQFFNALVVGMLRDADGGSGLASGIKLIEDMKKAALLYSADCPGWSDQVGLFFHVFGHNSVNAMHLHIIDLSIVGPTFWALEYKNCPIDAVLKVLREEQVAELEALDGNSVDAAQAALKAANAASEIVRILSLRTRNSRQTGDATDSGSDELLELNVGGHIVYALRSALLMAPKDSLMHRMFAVGSRHLDAQDAMGRPYLDMPGLAFAYIVDHFRLLRLTPPHVSLGPRRIPDPIREDVVDLAWVLGVAELVVGEEQVGRAEGKILADNQNLLPRQRSGLCCRRRSQKGGNYLRRQVAPV